MQDYYWAVMPWSLVVNAYYGRKHGVDIKQHYTHISMLQQGDINVNDQKI